MVVSNTKPTGSPSVLYTYIATETAPHAGRAAFAPTRATMMSHRAVRGKRATAALRRLVFHGRRAEYRRGYGQTARNQVVAGAIQMKRFGLMLTAAATAL